MSIVFAKITSGFFSGLSQSHRKQHEKSIKVNTRDISNMLPKQWNGMEEKKRESERENYSHECSPGKRVKSVRHDRKCRNQDQELFGQKWWKSIKFDSHHWHIIHWSVAWNGFGLFEFFFVLCVVDASHWFRFHHKIQCCSFFVVVVVVKMDRPKCYQINASGMAVCLL